MLSGVGAAAKADALIVSNTSSISMTKLAACLPAERRAKFAAAKIQQQTEQGNDDLRCLRSKFVIQGVTQGRQLQLERKAQARRESH